MSRALGLAILLALLPARASAQDSSALRLREATEAERRAEPAVAVAHYRALIEAEPTSRIAGRARRRLAWLEARAEGDYGPLAIHLVFRDRTPAERTASRVARFDADVRAFPPGLVRRESWLLLAEAWLALDEPTRAEAALEALLREPDLTESERVAAHTGIARARAQRDGAAAGAASLERAGLEDTATHDELARRARRGPGQLVAWTLIALFGLAAIAVGRRELLRREVLRRALGPWRLLVGAHIVLVPWLLAARYDHDAADTFASVAAGGAAILALASLAGVAASEREAPRAQRLGLAGLAALAYGAVGWLALDRAGQLLSFLA